MYVLRIFRTRSFAKEPISTCIRAIIWLFYHILLHRRASIRIHVGQASFVLDLPPVLRQAGSTSIYVQRQHYEPLLEFCDTLVHIGDVVIDCGASQGIYTCAFAALTGRSGKVIAFEPQDYAVDELRNNVRINGFDHVIVKHAAVSDHEGSATLDASSGAVSASIVRDFGRHAVRTVPIVTLESVLERETLDRLDLIKMDIEGAEYLALRGAEGLLMKYKPTLVLEANPCDVDWRRVVSLLTQYGYELHLFDSKGHITPTAELHEGNPDVIFMVPSRLASEAASN